MFLGEYSICVVTHENEVLVDSKVARLQIRPSIQPGVYQVLWRIVFSPNDFIQGEVRMLPEELREAFALSKSSHPGTMSEHHIRAGRFLNVPKRGTGTDGDPNISVYVSDEIREAVQKLLTTYEGVPHLSDGGGMSEPISD